MGFSTFDVTELPDDADEDFIIEFTTRDSKLGISLSEDEAHGIGHALLESVDGNMEQFDGKQASEI